MITLVPPTAARFAARASLPLVALGLALLAAPAHADAAEGWSDPADVNMLHALLLLGGVPLLLFLLIGLAVYVPPLVRGEDISPSGGGVESQWIGGPRPGAKELASHATSPSETGGAHGSW
ncbi:hypothetical protein [Nocardioides sp.]|uniref:hypothetical protein n=1 Tax=Nocardioides sp. TaxID=35761 RepID=UPI00286E431D|nr:hypothetical protein [Nocardioides sp.]